VHCKPLIRTTLPQSRVATAPYTVAALVTKARCTCETPEPTQTSSEPNPGRMGFLKASEISSRLPETARLGSSKLQRRLCARATDNLHSRVSFRIDFNLIQRKYFKISYDRSHSGFPLLEMPPCPLRECGRLLPECQGDPCSCFLRHRYDTVFSAHGCRRTLPQ
jgi:hypothetical protein